MLTRITATAVLCTLAFQANADTYRTGKITRLIVEADTVSVWLAGDAPSTECQADGRWVVTNNASEKTFKEKVALLITAASSGRPVGLHHDATQGCGTFGAKKIYYVDTSY